MKKSKPIVSVLILFALAVIGVNAQTQRRPYRVTDRPVSGILQRLEQSSNRFRRSLDTALIQDRIDETRPQNDINSFERAFESAIDQFRDRFNRRRATAADAQNVLQKAAPLNDILNHNRVSSQVQNDWARARTDLNALANAFGLTWQWNRQTLPPVSSSQSYPLSDRELDQLIRRIENGGDALRLSLTDAFDQTRYDPTRSEGSMNDALGRFKTQQINCAITSTPGSWLLATSNA